MNNIVHELDHILAIDEDATVKRVCGKKADEDCIDDFDGCAYGEADKAIVPSRRNAVKKRNFASGRFRDRLFRQQWAREIARQNRDGVEQAITPDEAGRFENHTEDVISRPELGERIVASTKATEVFHWKKVHSFQRFTVDCFDVVQGLAVGEAEIQNVAFRLPHRTGALCTAGHRVELGVNPE
jgi:hypothetical protein